MKYRKKPVVVEAFRFQIDPVMPDWFALLQTRNTIITYSDGTCKIKTLEGIMIADKGDYIIQGNKGEAYPCKPDIFKESYTLESDVGLSFGQAIERIKEGKKLARKGWNGKNQFVFLVKGAELQNSLKYGYGEYLGEPTVVSALAIKTTSNHIQIGWLASQTDMLAEDWEVVG